MPNDKYENEIRDILNRMDNFIPEGGGSPRRRQEPPQSGPRSTWWSSLRQQLFLYSSTQLLAGWVILALAAALLHNIFPPLGTLAALGSVACLVGAIVIPMLSRQYGRPERRWRGKVIDYQPAKIRRPFSWRYTWWRIRSFFGFR